MNQETSNYIQHHGVKGMRWGVRKSKKILDRLSKKKTSTKDISKMTGKDVYEKSKKVSKKASSKIGSERVSKLSDAELDARIARLEKEKKYKDLKKSNISRGRRLADNIIDKSIENIGTQAATYALGTVLNKAVKKDIVNPKKGQKDSKK